jgi:hypothetical protein
MALMCLCATLCAHAQLWSGIIDPSRAVDWTSAGVVGGIPSASWPQCGSTVAAGSSLTTVNNAISTCAANHFVAFAAGSFNFAGCVVLKSNVAIRGIISGGALATHFAYTSNACSACGGIDTSVCIGGSNSSSGSEQNVGDVTAGLTQGSTQIIISNIGTTTPAVGSIGTVAVGTPITIDQLDTATDTSEIWNCLVNNVCSNGGSAGAARTDGTCNGGACNVTNCNNGTVMCNRSQQQVVTVTSIVSCAGTTCTVNISPAIRMPNWSSAQKPQAWWANTFITNAGVENIQFDNTSGLSDEETILFFNATNSWAVGNASIFAGRSHSTLEVASHVTVQSNYLFEGLSHGSKSYGIEDFTDGDNLIANNIFQKITEPNPNNGGGTGVVFAYNFCINDVYVSPGWFQPCVNDHSSGNSFNLSEGNIGAGYQADNVHGTHNFLTTFRNRWIGWQAQCDGVACDAQTVPVQDYAASRFFNVIGNVLGETGYHTNYKCSATSSAVCSPGNVSIYALGFTGNGGNEDGTLASYVNACGGTGANPWDLCTTSSTMLWGNYDTVNGANQFNSAEVPAAIPQFSNAVPATHTLPASLYTSVKPSFWQGGPWPPIGPDVTGGNLKRCSGGSRDGSLATTSGQCPGGSLVADVSGEANSNPAFDCAMNVMGMPADGSGSALSFDPDTCYPTSSPSTPIATPGAVFMAQNRIQP